PTRVQNSNFVANKSTSQLATKSQINRLAIEKIEKKKAIISSKANSDTRQAFSKSISESHSTSNARGEKRTPREFLVRESPQVRDKIHATHKRLPIREPLQSTSRKRIGHEESSVRGPSNIKKLTNNPPSPSPQQMTKKRTMHFPPEPSRPAKRQQIKNSREDHIDEMNVSSIIQSIFRRNRPVRR
ncbi:11463_t:CDS:1, partial [Scutellospora calospora]